VQEDEESLRENISFEDKTIQEYVLKENHASFASTSCDSVWVIMTEKFYSI